MSASSSMMRMRASRWLMIAPRTWSGSIQVVFHWISPFITP